MGKTLMFTWILVLCHSMAAPVFSQMYNNYYSNTRPYVPKSERVVTNLHFYLHETAGGESPTAVSVARANITAASNNINSIVSFGSVSVIDDPLTVGPEHNNSEVIGNAQGIAVLASKDATTVVLYLDFGFTKGKFKGSSISMFSRTPVMEKERELAVVGGRGKFSMAEGFALLKTIFISNTSLVVEYNVTVIHY